MVFPSKVDTWLVVLLACVVAGVFGVIFFVTQHTPAPPPKVMIVVPFLVFGIILWSFRSTYYTVEGSTLIVKSAFMTWRIDIHHIDEITPTRNPMSSPALSLDRLELRYREEGRSRTMLVSPSEKRRFVEALRAVSPAIRYHPQTHENR
jgi:hypothetical protein